MTIATAMKNHTAARNAATAAYVAAGGDLNRFDARCPLFNAWQAALKVAGETFDAARIAASAGRSTGRAA